MPLVVYTGEMPMADWVEMTAQVHLMEEAEVEYGIWDDLAECESSGDWSINTGNGYYGGVQFSIESWRAVGGEGHPHEATRDEQIKRAEMLLDIQGWNAWPTCSRKLGLR